MQEFHTFAFSDIVFSEVEDEELLFLPKFKNTVLAFIELAKLI